MSPSSFIEESQIVAQAQPTVPRFERVALLLALVSCLVVLAIGFALNAVKFQVDGRIVTAALWIVPILGLITFFAIRPASSLSPTARMVRTKRNAHLLLGILTGVAVLGGYATAESLHTASDWFMLIFIGLSPISLFFLINTRVGSMG